MNMSYDRLMKTFEVDDVMPSGSQLSGFFHNPITKVIGSALTIGLAGVFAADFFSKDSGFMKKAADVAFLGAIVAFADKAFFNGKLGISDKLGSLFHKTAPSPAEAPA